MTHDGRRLTPRAVRARVTASATVSLLGPRVAGLFFSTYNYNPLREVLATSDPLL